MTAWYDSGGVQIHVGHVLDVLAQLPAESCQVVCTSPPYYGLRSYSTTPQIWGGSPDCDHTLEASPAGKVLTGGTGTASAKQVTNAGSQYGNAWAVEHVEQELRHGLGLAASPASTRGGAKKIAEVGWRRYEHATCTRCGAWRGELGSEPIPDCLAWARGEAPCSACFVCHLVTVFRAVRRVLHPTGTCWVNLGDSMSGGGPHHGTNNLGKSGTNRGSITGRDHYTGLGPKQLMMLPARVALALQADGWVLRSAITWAKKSPMPESVRDRPTNATEQVYLLAKQPTYYYDAAAVRSPYAPASIERAQYAVDEHRSGIVGELRNGMQKGTSKLTDIRREAFERNPAGANLRNFWLLGPEPYSAAHFATFPRKLVEPCVLAGTSARGQCPRCGAPWARVVARGEPFDPSQYSHRATSKADPGMKRNDAAEAPSLSNGQEWGRWKVAHPDQTTGWAPTCPHTDLEPTPQTVLDIFLGSGTTAYVARHHGRRAVGVELNESYARLAAARLRQGTLGLEIF